MLVLIQFRQHGRETPPVIKRRTVRSFRPALAWQCPVYPSGGYDLGGFYHTGYTGNEERPDAEDYLSSVQMGLWMPLSRAHGKTPREPWQYGDLALERVKKWINFRHRLAPYLYHTACQSHLFGIPMLRPLVMEYPKDPMAKMQNLSYMLGDSLLISPCL